jgi:hypothetical protein
MEGRRGETIMGGHDRKYYPEVHMNREQRRELLRQRIKLYHDNKIIDRLHGFGRPWFYIEENHARFPNATTEKYAGMGLPITKEELIAKLKLQDPNEYLKEQNIEDIRDVLNLDIKLDNNTKVVMYLLMLLNYTGEDQQNMDMTGSPSSGKSWIVKRVAYLFPHEDLDKNASCTPRVFNYSPDRKQMFMSNNDQENPMFQEIDWTRKPTKDSSDEEKKTWKSYRAKFVWVLNLAHKILIFVDQPNYKLTEALRSIRAHDQKYSKYSAVDKMKTETTFIVGYWTEIVCTAFTQQKQEERDRAWHLNPEWTKEKEKEVQNLLDKSKTDPFFWNSIENNPLRIKQKLRIAAIKEARIDDIFVPEDIMKVARENFDKNFTEVDSRKSREYDRYQKLIMACTLNNFAHRKTEVITANGSTVDRTDKTTESLESLTEGSRKIIWANEKDCDEALELYKPFMKAAKTGVSIGDYDIFEKVVEPVLNEMGTELDRNGVEVEKGATIRDITRKYREIYKRGISKDRLSGLLTTFADIPLIHEVTGRGSIPTKYYLLKEDSSETTTPPPHPQEILKQELPQETPKQESNGKPCPKCQKALPEDGSFTTFYVGKMYHLECYRRMKEEGEIR